VKAHRFTFTIIAILIVLVALANLETLMRPGTLTLPLLGTYVAPTRLIGFGAILAVAGVFLLMADAQHARLEARNAQDLRRIDALRSSLEAQEISRIDALSARMDTHLVAMTAKLETLKRAQRLENEPTPMHPST
jgi:hypothetical protein